jgi:hydroxymethylbilane synthase
MAARALRIGTRSSALALWQARHVAALISAQPGAPVVELVHIKTEGDLRTDVPLWAVGGRAFFTKEIDRALLANEVDLAVHSLKDLSTVLDSGIELVATLEREDSRDALLSVKAKSLRDLPAGSQVGTSSLRRRAFLAHARPDLVTTELRGNVPTRLERLLQGKYDAIILAVAGLKRLELDQHIAERVDIKVFTPAVSQGAVGVCARTQDEDTLRWLRALNHRETRLSTTAERALLRRIEGGCQVPLGASGQVIGDTLHLYAAVCALDGSEKLTAEGQTAIAVNAAAALDAAVQLGRKLADDLLARGADKLITRERADRATELP